MTTPIGCLSWALPLTFWSASAIAQTPPVRPTNEAIGSWILSCPAARKEPCLMRHRDWVVPPTNGLPGAALEVQRRGGLLVPVIAVRGLSPTAMVGAATVAKVSVSLRFDGAVGTDLDCGNSGTSYTCAPDATSLRSLAAQLPQARVLSASVTLAIPGMVAAPPLDRTLDLAGTEAALIRLQAAGATAETLPALPGLELQGFLDRIMKRLGFPGGTAGAIMKLLQYSH